MTATAIKERVLVVDDHPLFRDRLAQIINHELDMEVCGEAETVQQALEILQQSEPSLVIVDISLPGTGGLELIKQSRALGVKTPILVLSMHDETLYADGPSVPVRTATSPNASRPVRSSRRSARSSRARYIFRRK